MKRPVIIVDPLSSGIELAPAFKSRGVPVIAVTFKHLDRVGFGTEIQKSDFIEIIPNQPNLEEILKKYHPYAIIPGSESAVLLAENLASKLTPDFANDPCKLINRLHKGHMQEAIKQCGIAAIKTLNTADEKDVEDWIKKNELVNSPLIIKPPVSAGSDKVFHIPINGNWKKAFQLVLSTPSKITGEISDSVIVQEEAIGVEFAVGTISVNGEHSLTHLIKYNKRSSGERKTVFDYVEFVEYNEEIHGVLFQYTQDVLDALGVRWGATHTEIMLTSDGPLLIESGARMLGGPTVEFSRVATGSSQADKIVEAYMNRKIQEKIYSFKQTVVPVFLKSTASGIISNTQILDRVSTLPTLLNQFLWFKEGDSVSQTVDYLTSLGIIALFGERESIFKDYAEIRRMEKKLVINGVQKLPI